MRKFLAIVSILALAACDENMAIVNMGSTPVREMQSIDNTTLSEPMQAAAVTNASQVMPVSDVARVRLQGTRTIIVRAAQGNREIVGAKCLMQNSVYHASLVTPSYLELPKVAMKPSELKFTCQTEGTAGVRKFAPEAVAGETVSYAGDDYQVFDYNPGSNTFIVGM